MKTADVECVLSEAARQFGPIAILVNNAGVCAFSAGVESALRLRSKGLAFG